MIFFGSHPPRSLFLTSLIFLFPYKDLAFPLIPNATDPYSISAVECNDSVFWVNLGYYTRDCQQLLEDFYVKKVVPLGDREIEFTAPGYPGQSGLPMISLPAKLRSGLSFTLTATLN